jgi:hypothetical protein
VFVNGVPPEMGKTQKIMMSFEEKNENWINKMINSISRIRQKIRPGRHYPRQSRKPYSRWKSSNTSKKIVSISMGA